MFVTHWSSYTPCHSEGYPQTQQIVPYVINKLTQSIIPLVKKGTLLYSGEQASCLSRGVAYPTNQFVSTNINILAGQREAYIPYLPPSTYATASYHSC